MRRLLLLAPGPQGPGNVCSVSKPAHVLPETTVNRICFCLQFLPKDVLGCRKRSQCESARQYKAERFSLLYTERGGRKIVFLLVESTLLYTCSCQSLSRVWLFATPWTAAHQVPLFAQIHVHWVAVVIYSSPPLPLPSFVLNLSQHQGLFQTLQVNKCENQLNI